MMGEKTMTPETTTKRQASPPLTPQQERMQRAMIARLDALLTKHKGELYADWQAIMAEKTTEPVGTRLETCTLMAFAVFSGVAKRFPAELEAHGCFDEYLQGTSLFARLTRRNERLLAGLVLQGCQARGEF